MRTIIAIDPGASGGIVIWRAGCLPEAAKMPDEADLRDTISSAAQSVEMEGGELAIVIEQVGGFIKGRPAPGSAMFNFGNGYGYIRGLAAGLRIPLHLVRPQEWQKGIPSLAKATGPARKRALKEHAARLFPHVKVTLSTADALLIAHYFVNRRTEQ